MINKYGLQMHGLKAAAGATRQTGVGYYDGYVQIGYKRSTGDIIAVYHVSQNSWTPWNGDTVTVANARGVMSMQRIADAIRGTLDELEELEAWKASFDPN